jgi:hypothetical protein
LLAVRRKLFSLHPSGGAAFGDEMVGVSVGAYLMGPANACNVHYDNVPVQHAFCLCAVGFARFSLHLRRFKKSGHAFSGKGWEMDCPPRPLAPTRKYGLHGRGARLLRALDQNGRRPTRTGRTLARRHANSFRSALSESRRFLLSAAPLRTSSGMAGAFSPGGPRLAAVLRESSENHHLSEASQPSPSGRGCGRRAVGAVFRASQAHVEMILVSPPGRTRA